MTSYMRRGFSSVLSVSEDFSSVSLPRDEYCLWLIGGCSVYSVSELLLFCKNRMYKFIPIFSCYTLGVTDKKTITNTNNNILHQFRNKYTVNPRIIAGEIINLASFPT